MPQDTILEESLNTISVNSFVLDFSLALLKIKSIKSYFYLFIYLFIYLFVCLSIYLFIYLFICLFVCLFVCLFIYLFIYLFIVLFLFWKLLFSFWKLNNTEIPSFPSEKLYAKRVKRVLIFNTFQLCPCLKNDITTAI